MADRKAARRFTLDGKTYKKGAKVSLGQAQTEQFERAGMLAPLEGEDVAPAPAKTKTLSKKAD